MSRILVTGANRGIGLEVCRQLVQQGHEVVLTARDKVKGNAAAAEVGATFMQLDVSDSESIETFIDTLSSSYDYLDVLINNAGIYIDGDQKAVDVEFATVYQTMETNVYGPWRLINGLLPILKKSQDPRIINVSSGLGAIHSMGSGQPSYRLSKVALNALTLMLHADIGSIVKINTMCPGWVRTDMGGANATRSLAEGADTAIWLATAKDIPNGKFIRDRKEIEW